MPTPMAESKFATNHFFCLSGAEVACLFRLSNPLLYAVLRGAFGDVREGGREGGGGGWDAKVLFWGTEKALHTIAYAHLQSV